MINENEKIEDLEKQGVNEQLNEPENETHSEGETVEQNEEQSTESKGEGDSVTEAQPKEDAAKEEQANVSEQQNDESDQAGAGAFAGFRNSWANGKGF